MNGLILFTVLCAVGISNAILNPPGCGLRPHARQGDKVVGGHQANVGDYGWVCTMRRNGGFICGGSIVDENFYITAAHCPFGNTNPAVYLLDCGVHDRLNMEAWAQTMRVGQVIMHPQYSSATLRNDIALMRFATPLPIDNNMIIPVCIPDGSEDWQGKFGDAVGWGTLFSGGSVSRYKMEVNMLHLTNNRCVARFGTSVDPNLQMCAGEVGEGKDTCQGDSGGPYTCPSSLPGQTNKHFLIGITSWGYGCGDGGVYTKTAGYFSWISGHVNTGY